MYKAKTRVGCDGFHPKVPLDLTKETRGGEFLEKVEQSGNWPQQACTTMFFLILKNVTKERPIALMPTLIRWWEAFRAPEVAKWQQKYRVDWDATDGRNGGAQQTVVGNFDGMERFCGHAKGEDQRAVALVLDQAKAFDRVSLPVVWAWATHFTSQGRLHECFVVISSSRGGCSSKDVRHGRYEPSRPFCQDPSGVACFCALCRRMR